MYVRWQWRGERKRKITRYYWTEKAIKYAALVESTRVDGKPRQKHVAYLGSVHYTQDTHYRAWWWYRMSKKLDTLANRVLPDDRRKIEAVLAKEVPPVTTEEVMAFDLAYQEKFRAEHGECRGCYLRWPDGQTGVPPRPPKPPKGERWAKTLAAVAAARR